MKITVINGGPRKNWNTDQLTKQFVDGIKSQIDDVEIKEIYVYDYQFSGCRSCFACKLKKFENKALACRYQDSITDLLLETRNSDVIVLSSPIYFTDLSAQLKLFLERLMYPGKINRIIPTALLVTMGGTNLQSVKSSLDITCNYWFNNFNYRPDIYSAVDTFPRHNEHLYRKSSADNEAKRIKHEKYFNDELKRFYNHGIEFINKLKPEE